MECLVNLLPFWEEFRIDTVLENNANSKYTSSIKTLQRATETEARKVKNKNFYL